MAKDKSIISPDLEQDRTTMRQLERLVDAVGVQNTVRMTAAVCYAKAGSHKENEKPIAKEWHQLARDLDRFARRTRGGIR